MPRESHWNWEQKGWPVFRFDGTALASLEAEFLRRSGIFIGATMHVAADDKQQLIVDLIADEALQTSEIEGEILNRDSVQSSIRRQLGLASDYRKVLPAEQGIGEMMVDLYRNYSGALDEKTLFSWHRMIVSGRTDLRDIGRYRTHAEPMQIVSGKVYDPNVHFEAPPSHRVGAEMERYLDWFNRTAPSGSQPTPVLTRAAIAHLYFESIHPFEDGNGRIGRVIAEKVFAQSLGRPSLTAIAATILANRKNYYARLEDANKSNEVTGWLVWFAGISLEAQQRTLAEVEFLIAKTKLLDQFRDKLNSRQLKVLLRVLREGPSGFDGGLSASNYATIAKTSNATTTRDLTGMVKLCALTRTGKKRYARYFLPISVRPALRFMINENGDVTSR